MNRFCSLAERASADEFVDFDAVTKWCCCDDESEDLPEQSNVLGSAVPRALAEASEDELIAIGRRIVSGLADAIDAGIPLVWPSGSGGLPADEAWRVESAVRWAQCVGQRVREAESLADLARGVSDRVADAQVVLIKQLHSELAAKPPECGPFRVRVGGLPGVRRSLMGEALLDGGGCGGCVCCEWGPRWRESATVLRVEWERTGVRWAANVWLRLLSPVGVVVLGPARVFI